MRRWCDCQMKCKEDTKDTWTCGAHLADGLVFICKRNPIEVEVDKDGGYRLDKCPDFEPPGYDINGNREKEYIFKW